MPLKLKFFFSCGRASALGFAGLPPSYSVLPSQSVVCRLQQQKLGGSRNANSPALSESETLGMGPSDLCFNKSSRRS